MKTFGWRYALLLSRLAIPAARMAGESDRQTVERGRYLLIAGGCTDCHTPGYMQTEGNVPEPLWLTGSPVGFQGPWDTTYPADLRLLAQQMSETQWLARTPADAPAHALVRFHAEEYAAAACAEVTGWLLRRCASRNDDMFPRMMNRQAQDAAMTNTNLTPLSAAHSSAQRRFSLRSFRSENLPE
jgi:hypothetical protein